MTDTVSFTYGNVSGEVRQAKGADRFRMDVVRARLPDTITTANPPFVWIKFAEFVGLTVNVKGLPIEWPSVNATADQLQAAFDVWDSLPNALIAAWDDAITTANLPPGDAATLPDVDVKN